MKIGFAVAFAFALHSPMVARAITVDTVPVGNPGNAGEIQTGGIIVGQVATNYRIATTEVTNAQYIQFLNAVASSDAFGLYNTNMSFYSQGGILRAGTVGSYTYSVKPDVPGQGPGGSDYTYGDKPVVFVSWYDAARFTNWVNNGATASASTETGAYTMANGVSVSRNSGAIWFLPNENQWYKAAYHKNDGVTANYWDYPTESNAPPSNNLPSNDTGNSANFFGTDFTTGNASYPMTGAGAYMLSSSAYGTLDQGGNVWEWTETYTSASQTRVRRGGAYNTDDVSKLAASYRESINPASESESLGFRLATVPQLPGDYNANGSVDAGDYVLWRKYLGTGVTLPNDSTPGTAAGDYDVWRSHFGQTPGGGISDGGLLQSAIPEPSACALIVAGACIALFHRRQKLRS